MHIVYSHRHTLHTTDQERVQEYPFASEEIPARAEAILRALETARLGPVTAPPDHGLEPILDVHDADFVDFLRRAYDKEAGPVLTWTFATRYTGRKPKGFVGLKGYYALGWGSPILKGTWEAAYWSAQCALTAADVARAGERVVYALCRPPGHHAASDLYGGFCYLNNAAIAARYLGQEGARVAILDIDYHHGNGTQQIFYADPAVLFCSLHAHPDDDFPWYWGDADERGVGAGEGLNQNWPLPQGTDDALYLEVLDKALASISEFDPGYLVVSAGFDTVKGDPVGGFSLTNKGLQAIGNRIATLGRSTIIVQEGGYRIDSLGKDVVAFLRAFV